MRTSRLLLPLLCLSLGGAAADSSPFGGSFQRLDRGRASRTTLPAGSHAIAVYYGASWCGPCRAFVPELVAAYPVLRSRGVEVIFVSDDASCAATLDYARTSRMPWLLLPCDRRRHHRLRVLGGRALPGLAVFEADGEKVDSSWQAAGISAPRSLLRRLLTRQGPSNGAVVEREAM